MSLPILFSSDKRCGFCNTIADPSKKMCLSNKAEHFDLKSI